MDSAPVDRDTRRGPLGKADAPGLCAPNDCDSQSADGCWCDDLCDYYGDCCSNKVSTCDTVDDNLCGSWVGDTCDDDEYCHYDPQDICGAADAPGTCKTPPEACIEIYSPVCSCDGVTYGNSCLANAAGASVASIGECKTFCGGFAGIQCPDGQQCIDDPDDDCDPQNGGADCGGMCVDLCAPVVCTLACPDGFEIDDNGCEICECAEPEPTDCCSLDDKPGESGNPFCIEGATCCANGTWQCNLGNGQPSCSAAGETCEPEPQDSCALLCGGQAPDGCWCDDLCSFYNDCCDDKALQCDA